MVTYLMVVLSMTVSVLDDGKEGDGTVTLRWHRCTTAQGKEQHSMDSSLLQAMEIATSTDGQ